MPSQPLLVLEMRPPLTMNYPGDFGLSHAEALGYRCLGFAECAPLLYRMNALIRQLSISVRLAAKALESLLRLPIVHVGLMRSKKKVARVAAPFIVARVANEQTIGDWSEVERPAETVGRILFAFELHSSIAVGGDKSGPIQTLAIDAKLGIEPSGRRRPSLTPSFMSCLFGLDFEAFPPRFAASSIWHTHTMPKHKNNATVKKAR